MKYQWEYLTGTGIVSNKPVYISNIVLSSDGLSTSKCDYYDGTNTAGRHILTIRTAKAESMRVAFNPPLKTERGLYIVEGSNFGGTLIQYVLAED